jgi:hypothetical protein
MDVLKINVHFLYMLQLFDYIETNKTLTNKALVRLKI